jgi:hypothetical protein
MPLTVGVIELDGGGELGLARAVERHRNLDARAVHLAGGRKDDVAALVVDAPLQQRAELVGRLVESGQCRC